MVSVIVPAYNQAEYLPAALDSVLAQTHHEWECIIINDGSTDETEKIAKSYAKKDTRFKYFKRDNGGLSSARNAGLKLAGGNWIQFLDSDDYIEPGKFEHSFGLFNEYPDTQIIVSNFKMFIDDPANATVAFCELNQERLNYGSILFGWGPEFVIPIHCGLFKRNLFDKVSFDENLKSLEDWIMWLDLFKAEPNASYINKPMAYYRNNPQSMTKDKTVFRNNLIIAYKYVLNTIPDRHIIPFSEAIIDRLNTTINLVEADLEIIKKTILYRFEKSAKKLMRSIIGRKPGFK